jgi:hypothetical protein
VTCATAEVEVVSVAVASGWGVSVGAAGEENVGVKAAAVRVNCDITVLAADVRIAATSGVESAGVAEGPHAAINAATRKQTRNSFSFMEPLYVLKIAGYFLTTTTTVSGVPK